MSISLLPPTLSPFVAVAFAVADRDALVPMNGGTTIATHLLHVQWPLGAPPFPLYSQARLSTQEESE